MLTAPSVEQLLLLLNDIHVRLEMLREIAANESHPEFDRILDEIKVQELVILAKLAELGINL